jgi:hypothetical protein
MPTLGLDCTTGDFRNRSMAADGKTRAMAKKEKPAPPSKRHLDKLLDEALKETFPASDPIAVSGDDPPANDDGDNKERSRRREP